MRTDTLEGNPGGFQGQCVFPLVSFDPYANCGRDVKKNSHRRTRQKKRKPRMYLLGHLATSVPARVHPGSISLHFHYGTSHTAERSSRWDVVPEGDSHSDTKWRSRIMKSTSRWTGKGIARA